MKIQLFAVRIPHDQEVPKGMASPDFLVMFETLRRNVRKLFRYRSEDYVLVHGTEIVGSFAKYGDGIREGYKRFGLDQFLVQKVGEIFKPLPMPKTWDSIMTVFRGLREGRFLLAECS